MPGGKANLLDARKSLRVRKMNAVPRQQKVYSVNGGYGDMGSVARGFPRQDLRPQYLLREQDCPIIDGKQRKWLDQGETPLSRSVVPLGGFIQDDPGNNHAKVASSNVPPLTGNLLSGSYDQVTARPACEVARNRGFKVKRWDHNRSLHWKLLARNVANVQSYPMPSGSYRRPATA